MKKNLKRHKNIRRYGRLPYLSSKNSLNSIFPTFINNLYFFESKKSNIYFSKMLVFLKIIFLSYLYVNAISSIYLENLQLSSNFSKNFISKINNLNNNSINMSKENIRNNLFVTSWRNTFTNNVCIIQEQPTYLFSTEYSYENWNTPHYVEYLYTYSLLK